MPAPSAVLFDFDGVIADTENVHIAAWERVFESMGWEVPPETCARAAEIDDRLFLSEVFILQKISQGDIAGWVRRKQDLTVQMLHEEPRIYTGVADVLEWLAPRTRLALVSTASHETINAVLRPHHLDHYFEQIVGKEDFTRPKPSDEPYKVALSRLNLNPDEAVALEDSPAGVTSATTAGIRCLAVGHRHRPGAWSESATYLPDFRDREQACRLLGFEEEIRPGG